MGSKPVGTKALKGLFPQGWRKKGASFKLLQRHSGNISCQSLKSAIGQARHLGGGYITTPGPGHFLGLCMSNYVGTDQLLYILSPIS
jgi:hypothetical protein